MKKKILLVLMLLVVLVMPFASVDAKTTTTKKATKTTKKAAKKKTTAAKKPVNVYIFYGKTCGFCARLHEYTTSLEKDESINYMFNIVDYEVWYDETNSNLMNSVGKYFNKSISGVPVTVIGDQIIEGYAESMNNQIVKTIKDAYEKQTKDVVASIGKGNELKYVPGENSGTETEVAEKGNSAAAYVIIGITVVVVLLIIFGKSKSDKFYDEEEDEDEEEESETEVVEEEEEVVEEKSSKKNSNKSTSAKKKTNTKKRK